ncbi:alcohol dehydrogenase catalytic domain-containing protein [Mesorhizobium marinum]|uniref:alcohol dehydrogenase n=1 Tax=Mesorhizobium marinum TaxID=3228790 RepID=A0ABV3R365_9HYPH
MSELMLAAVLEEYGQPLRLTRVPRPEPGPGQILIRLEASGVCHSDVHVWRGEMPPASAPSPFILGHEGIGVVAAVGPDVQDWNPGERAGIGWLHDTCGECAECLDGAESFCQSQRAHGYDVAGTFAEYVVADARFAFRVPAGAASGLAPLMCAGVTAYGAIERAQVKHGECCAIFGCGGLGQYAIQLARRRGARVVAVDRDAGKLDRATSLGAVDTKVADAGLATAWPPQDQVASCINFAPTPASWDAMISAVQPRGRIVAAAMVAEPVAISQEWLASTGVTVTGTSVGTRAQMHDLLALHEQEPLASHVAEIALGDVSDALADLRAGRAQGRFAVVF